MKRHNLQPPFRESSDSLRQQAASTNLPMPFTPASGNGVYALAFGAIPLKPSCFPETGRATGCRSGVWIQILDSATFRNTKSTCWGVPGIRHAHSRDNGHRVGVVRRSSPQASDRTNIALIDAP